MARSILLRNLPVFSIINPPDPDFNFAGGAAFLLDKPKKWTSYELVKKVRKCVDMHQVGHAGTLDPMATGLMIVCCGKGTKSIAEIQQLSKAYRAELTLGASTPSFDAETKIDDRAGYDHITRQKVLNILAQDFIGNIEQIPPMYSAVKYNGKPLYKFARKGKKVKRKARIRTIYAARIIDLSLPQLKLHIKCSSGTYIRSIAHQLGKKLHSLAYLSALKRTNIGHFYAEDALSIDDLDLIFGG